MRGFCQVPGCGVKERARQMCHRHYMRWWSHGDVNAACFIPAKAGEPWKFIQSLPLIGDGCVIWPFAKNNMGYGQLSKPGGKRILAHRLACERKNGPAPSSVHHAAHSCGKGHLGCVSPWHLSWKLPIENSADRLKHGTVLRGEASKSSKITEADVMAIRALNGVQTQESIGKQFGISQSAVGQIIRRERWRHLP